MRKVDQMQAKKRATLRSVTKRYARKTQRNRPKTGGSVSYIDTYRPKR